jgi:cysteine desulfurase family protein (TIGR01976 family)
MQVLNTELVRSYFPALQQDFIFMDNAGGSQILQPVIDKVQKYWIEANVQHGASYAVSQKAKAMLAEGKAAMAALLNPNSPEELVMGGSASLLIKLLAESFGRILKAGDEIIVSAADHEANVSPWTDLERLGIKIKIWQFRESDFLLHSEDLDQLLSPRTRIVACTHCSNVLGAINPIREIADKVHAHEAKLVVDGVAYAPHRLVDVQALDADFYVYSLYKIYGPHYGVMYGKKELWEQLPGMNHYFIKEDDIPYKMEPGGENYELVYGMTGLTDYLKAIALAHGAKEGEELRTYCQQAFDLFTTQETAIAEKLIAFLQSRSNVRIIGPATADPQQRVSTIAFVVEGMKSDEIVKEVDPHHIGIRFGDFYAKKVIASLGLQPQNGVVRVSMVHYNTVEEVDRLIAVLEQIIS